MKILQLVTKRQYRGAEVFAANLSSELIKSGHEIIFAGLYKNDKDILEVKGADNRDLALQKTGGLSVSLVQKLVKLVEEIKPDVIQCNGSDTLKYMVAASFLTPKPPIVYRNISMISAWFSSTPKKLLYRQIFKKVAHVSSVGDEAREDFIQTLHYPRKQTSVVRRGIPLKNLGESFRGELKSNLNLKANDKIAMHIGNFSPEKNHDFLLDVFASIKEKNTDIKLVCVGNGILFNEIKEKVRLRKMEDTVFLLGFRQDIPELLYQADCFVLASKVEGVPGVILEAAAQKKPSVATNVGGVSEVLMDKKTGYLVNNFDKSDFENKLLKLLQNKDIGEQMGSNAYALVKNDFNPERNSKIFEDIYLDLMGKV